MADTVEIRISANSALQTKARGDDTVSKSEDKEYVAPLTDAEIVDVRSVLDARDFRIRLWGLFKKLGAFVPWILGALILAKDGEWLEALKWLK